MKADESLEQVLAREEALHQSLEVRLATLEQSEAMGTRIAENLLAADREKLGRQKEALAQARSRAEALERGAAVGLPWAVRLGKVWRVGLRTGAIASVVVGSGLLAMAGAEIGWPLLSLMGGLAAAWFLSDAADREELR